MDSFRLEVPYVPGEAGRTMLLFAAGTLLVVGLVGAVVNASTVPLVFAATGCTIYASLLLKHPAYRYITAVTIDAEGVWFLREVRPGGKSSRYSWHEIKAVSMLLASSGEEIQGLEVTTTRHGQKGVPIVVPIASALECKAAHRVAQSFLMPGAESAA